MHELVFRKSVASVLLLLTFASAISAQSLLRTGQASQASSPTHANLLRGQYGRYRANNDLLFYDLNIRVDPEKKFVSGKNTIRFKMLKDDTRIQLDLYDNLKVDKILFQRSEGRGRTVNWRNSSTNAIRERSS